MNGKINMGRVGVVLAGAPQAGVLCWPHANAIKGEKGITLFRIKEGQRPCNICDETQKGRN